MYVWEVDLGNSQNKYTMIAKGTNVRMSNATPLRTGGRVHPTACLPRSLSGSFFRRCNTALTVESRSSEIVLLLTTCERIITVCILLRGLEPQRLSNPYFLLREEALVEIRKIKDSKRKQTQEATDLQCYTHAE